MARPNILDLMPGSTRGSRARNLFSYSILLLGLLIGLELAFSWVGIISLTPTPLTTGVFAAFGFVFFFATTIALLRLHSANFPIAPGRLIRDIGISIGYSILSFALFYRTAGITPTFPGDSLVTARDCLYFSVVTFSTLGYGDFRPVPDARMMASAQALLGTIHIGMIVGAVYITFGSHPNQTPRRLPSRRPRKRSQGRRPSKRRS